MVGQVGRDNNNGNNEDKEMMITATTKTYFRINKSVQAIDAGLTDPVGQNLRIEGKKNEGQGKLVQGVSKMSPGIGTGLIQKN